MKLLLIDDEENLLDLFKVILNKKGYEVDIANTLNNALKLLDNNKYDFILIDYYIGNGNSLNFIENLLKNYEENNVCICTGSESEKDYKNLRKIGITKILKKPITYKQILEKID